MAKVNDAGVKEYRETYWMQDYASKFSRNSCSKCLWFVMCWNQPGFRS